MAVERLRLGILARFLQHEGEVAEAGGGFGRPLAVLVAGEVQQLFKMSECDRVLRRPLCKFSSFVETVIGRIKTSSLVKVRSRLAPFDLNGGDLSSLERCLGGSYDGRVRTVFNLR